MEPTDRFEVVDGDDVADHSVGQELFDPPRVRRVAKDMAHAEEDTGGRGRSDGRGAVVLGAGERFLTEDVVPSRGERLDRRPVIAVLGGDDDSVGNPVGGDEVVPVGERRVRLESERVGTRSR